MILSSPSRKCRSRTYSYAKKHSDPVHLRWIYDYKDVPKPIERELRNGNRRAKERVAQDSIQDHETFINTKEAHKCLVGNTLRGSELGVLQGIEKAEEVKII